MHNEVRFTQEEKEEMHSAKLTLDNLQKFFKGNGVGKQLGGSLINRFINFTFTGGASVGEDVESSVEAVLQNPDIKEWLEYLSPRITELAKNNADLLDDLYSEVEGEFPHQDMLCEAFLDTMFGSEQSLNDESLDGTVNVIACLAVLKASNADCEILTLIQNH